MIRNNDEKEPEFMLEKLEQITKKLKNNKAAGSDRIINEQIKFRRSEIIKNNERDI